MNLFTVGRERDVRQDRLFHLSQLCEGGTLGGVGMKHAKQMIFPNRDVHVLLLVHVKEVIGDLVTVPCMPKGQHKGELFGGGFLDPGLLKSLIRLMD